MPLRFQKRISRADLRTNPDALYAFGDNMARIGYGGQAREMRGEPNAVGIPTKWRPSNAPSAFFKNADLSKVQPTIDAAFDRLSQHLRVGGAVVLPADGLGTGLARLSTCAPVIHAYIRSRVTFLGTLR